MSFLAKFAASKYVGDKLEDNFGPQNPKYDIQTLPSGRRKKTKRPLPPGLTAHEARVLKAVRRKAHRYEWLVDCRCCGCCGGLHLQFGTATVWGLLPVVGDLVSLLQALSLVRAARRADLPAGLTLALLAWAAADFLVKLVPVAGDVLAAVVKPNTRNLVRVEACLRARGERRLRAAGLPVVVPGAPGAGAGPGADEPLLVASQPPAQGGMVSGAAAAGPSYGTVRAAAAADGAGPEPESGRAAGGGRKGGSRHLLPFWRDEEDTDSEEEARGAPGPALAVTPSGLGSRS